MYLESADLVAIADALVERLQQLADTDSRLAHRDRIGFPEAEAAELLGIPQHVLRDCRLRGEIFARKIGKRFVYSRQTLLDHLSGKEPN